MTAFSFNSQLSSFLPREDFFSESETETCVSTINGQDSNSLSLTTSPQSNLTNNDSKLYHSVSVSPQSCLTITESYKSLISKRPINGIKSIAELINWKPVDRESVISCIFGVVKSVRDSKGTKFKYVTLVDPTNETGIDLETFGTQEKIAVGQMMKACQLKVQRTGSSLAYMFTTSTKTTFFPLFSYNYDNPAGDERNKALTETRFSISEDREICHLLEQWFSLKIFNGTKLSSLPKPGEFVDICCQVLAFNKSPLCINAVIWDTSEPKYKPLFGPDGRLPQGFEYINFNYFPISYGKYFPLAIWKEEGNDQAQHYDTFRCIDFSTGDDLVVLFNLQIVEDHNHPGKAQLVMRSARKWGKAVRLCHRNSILGQMFIKKSENYKKESLRKLNISEHIEVHQPQQQPQPQPQQQPQPQPQPQPQTQPQPQPQPQPQTQPQPQPQSQSQSLLQPPPPPQPQSTTPTKKRKADEVHNPHVENIEPQPSTSGYSLRSQRRVPTQTDKQPLERIDEDPLTRLKNKAKKELDWDILLSNGLQKLKLLHEILEEEFLLGAAFPLNREEFLQFVALAIEYLAKSSKSPTETKTSGVTSDSDDSIMTEGGTFPVVDRVKYFTS